MRPPGVRSLGFWSSLVGEPCHAMAWAASMFSCQEQCPLGWGAEPGRMVESFSKKYDIGPAFQDSDAQCGLWH